VNVIHPTPSQAAVVLKNYFRRKNIDLDLGTAQEAIALTKGYASWNALASNEDPRGRTGKSKQSTPKEAPLAPTQDELFAVSGRIHGDDDDTLLLIWAPDEDAARQRFKGQLRSDRGRDDQMDEDNDSDDHSRVYVVEVKQVGSLRIDGFRLAKGNLPPTLVVAPVSDAESSSGAACKKCSSPLEGRYCPDVTCPYHDWPQGIPLEHLEGWPTAELELGYGPKRVAATEEEPTLIADIQRLSQRVAARADNEREEALDDLKWTLEAKVDGTELFGALRRLHGRDERALEGEVPYIQLSYDIRLNNRFSTELVVTLRDHKLDVYVRTWESLDGIDLGSRYQIVDEQSGDFDTNAERPDDDAPLSKLLENALKEAGAHKASLQDRYNIR
jgi:hypothetical protein